MFLEFLQKYNPKLIDTAFDLHQKKMVSPNTYILDLDAILLNAKRLSNLADSYNIKLYFMSKQIGRNPFVTSRVLENGFDGAVAVDFDEALLLHSAGIKISHIGHLVQIPDNSIEQALAMNTDTITVYSICKARCISEAAMKINRVQNITIRVYNDGDIVYPSQGAGIHLNDLESSVNEMLTMSGINIFGITSFPCFLYDDKLKRSVATQNAETVIKAKSILQNKFNINISHINMPSCNSLDTILIASKLGATHLEPGHALTGTNPDNLFSDNPLIPSMLYLTEVSHNFNENAYVFGGGYYRRSNIKNAIISTNKKINTSKVNYQDSDAIDYHLVLESEQAVGSSVILAFRTQIFVTRSRVMVISGLSNDRVKVEGVWDSQGHLIHL